MMMRWLGLKKVGARSAVRSPPPLWGRPGGGSRRRTRQGRRGVFANLLGLRDPPPCPAPAGGAGTLASKGKVLLLLPLLAALAGPALAVEPDEVMKNPALEARARALSEELRCLVCQNESIDDSEAPLARDIRLLIRERIREGESNDQVRAYLVSRYGDFILLKPPFQADTWLLWLSPVLILGLGGAAALYARRRAPRSTPALTADEEARLAALTGGDASGG
jgi:cytochrome c-type biogenesis protein CcmH